jgi:hypothetical protein
MTETLADAARPVVRSWLDERATREDEMIPVLSENQMRARHAAYVAAFNGQDIAAVSAHLAPDVHFDWGEVMPPLTGRDAFVAFFVEAWTYLHEHVRVTDVRVHGSTLTAWIENDIEVLRDWPDCPIRPMRAGTSSRVSGWMSYTYDGPLICRIADSADLQHPTTSEEHRARAH